MLAVCVPSLRLVMLPVPSAWRNRVSACPPMKPPPAPAAAALSAVLPSPLLLITEMDFARGLWRRDRSQFLTRAPADSLADSGDVNGESGEISLLGPFVLVVVPLVWIRGVKGRERRLLCGEVVSSVNFSSRCLFE